jgi:hypothetical protein
VKKLKLKITEKGDDHVVSQRTKTASVEVLTKRKGEQHGEKAEDIERDRKRRRRRRRPER